MSAAGESSMTDPTRSVTRRRRFAQEFRRRWRELRGVIRDNTEHTDRFGLSDDGELSAEAAVLLGRFRRWVRRQVDEIVVEPMGMPEVRDGRHWTAQYVRESYEHGLDRADTALRKAEFDAPDQSPAAALLEREHREKLSAEYVRTYQSVEDAGEALVSDLSQTFDELLEGGASRRDTADELNDRVTTIGRNTHSDPLAHGAVVVVINRAALQRYRTAGVEEVGAIVEQPIADGEVSVTGPVTDDPVAARGGAPADPSAGAFWQTAGDNRVCPQCRALAGRSWPLSAFATGDAPIPVRDTHPRCRCWLVPIPNYETQN